MNNHNNIKKSLIRIIICLLTAFNCSFSLNASMLANKGIGAYKNGDYNRARQFFQHAMQQAVLQADEALIIRASLNLVDIELDAQQYKIVGDLLGALPTTTDKELLLVIQWKTSQYQFRQGRVSAALTSLQAGQKACAEGGYEFCHSMTLDIFRMRAALIRPGQEDAASLSRDISQFKGRLKKRQHHSLSGLEALLAMLQGEYAQAADLWHVSVDYNREAGKFVHMAECLNYLALCQLKTGKLSEANLTNNRATGVYRSLGLELPALRTYALTIFMEKDQKKVDKIQRELELIQRTQPDFNLFSIIQEYIQFAQLPAPSFLTSPDP